MDSRTLDLITTCLPTFSPLPQSVKMTGTKESIVTLALPPAPGADYAFSLSEYQDGRQISAIRIGGPEQEYFWNRAFESADYKDSEALHERYLAELELLLTFPTRITQKEVLCGRLSGVSFNHPRDGGFGCIATRDLGQPFRGHRSRAVHATTSHLLSHRVALILKLLLVTAVE